MSMPSRLAAAATVLALVVFSAACAERIVIQIAPGNGRSGRVQPLQVASSTPVVPLAPGFLRCDGVPMRFGDSIVCFDEVERTWQQAEDHCMQIGGHLARISSAAQSQALAAAFGAPLKLPGTLWIGLVEPFRQGEWGWMTGKKTGYVNWNAGEPNDAGGGEDCGEWITSNGAWNDIDCAAARAPLCEGAAPAKGVKSSFTCNGILIHAGDTPYCAYIDRAVTAAQAEQLCKATGGHLAELSTAEKDKALFAALRPRAGSGADVWIGFTDARKEGDWRYLSGEPASFTGWRQGEPNNVGASGEDCATWGPVDGGWNDLPCETKAQSLCEGPAITTP